MNVDDLIENEGTAPATTPSAETTAPDPSPEPESEYGPPESADEDTSTGSDAPSATPEEGPKAAVTDTTPAHDEQLLADAQLIGFTRGEAEAMAPAALERAVRVAFRNVATARQQAVERMADQPKLEPFKIDLDPDEYDEKLIATLKNMDEHYQRQLADLNERTQYAASQAMEAEQQARRRFEQEFTSKFDQDLAGIGLDDVFGKGTVADIKGNDTAFKNRMAVLDHMDMDAERFLRRGEKPPSQEVLFQRALRAEFGDRLIQKQQQALSQKVEKRASQILPRPSSSPHTRKATGFAAVKDEFRRILGSGESHSIDDMLAE